MEQAQTQRQNTQKKCYDNTARNLPALQHFLPVNANSSRVHLLSRTQPHAEMTQHHNKINFYLNLLSLFTTCRSCQNIMMLRSQVQRKKCTLNVIKANSATYIVIIKFIILLQKFACVNEIKQKNVL